MLRHKWFIILIALQILNFAGMALFEQQRRSLWNKEVAHIQQRTDTKLFADQTEESYNNVARLIAGLDKRVSVLQIEAEKNIDNAALIKDTRDRLLNLESSLRKLESSLQKLQPDK